MRNKEINLAIKEWKNKFIDNLKSHRNKNIEVYFIPKEWENDTLSNNNLSYFNKNIKNKNDLISSKSEFFIIEKEYFKNVKDYSEKDLIKAEAKFENDKLIIDLGNDNFYFYYLNSKNNLCEGSIESKGINKEKNIIKGFKFNPPHDFIYHCLNEVKPEFKNNSVIYYINKFIFTYKNDEELINDLNKQKINNKGNDEDNKVINEKEIKIIKCIIYYFFSEYKYKYFLDEEIKYKNSKRITKNELKFIKYKNSKRITKNELKFILINKEWINLFKEKYNYKHYKKKIDDYKINKDNYLNNLKYFKKINSEIIEPIKSTKVININLMNKSYKIFQNYEFITQEAYDILVKFFGKEKNEENFELSVINIDLSYILVKYNSKMIEIIKIKDESERFLIIGKTDLYDSILIDLLNKGFKTWLKINIITDYKNYSIEIVEKGKIIGMLYYLPKLKFNGNNKTKNDNIKMEDVSLPPEGLLGLQNNGKIFDERMKENFKKYYEISEDRIGKGRFGKVYKAIDKESKELRAIKIIEFDENEKEIKNEIINELKYMKICSNDGKNLYSVRLYEYFINKNDLAIVMELCDNNLLQVLNMRKECLNSKKIYEIMNQLNDTFKIMIKNKIVHRDIKLENILVKFKDKQKTNFISKLTDYGISKQMINNTIYTSHVGTSLTMAPELLEGKDKYDNKCDLWSIGVIIYQLFFGIYPYKGNTEVMLLNKINDEGQNNLKYTGNNYLDNLIRGLLVKNPQKRITWQKYLYHPFFREYRSKEDYKIYYEKLENERIGKGGFGVVYKAKEKVTNELRAMKIIETECNVEEYEIEIKGLINELNNMDKCNNDYRNEYSVKFYDFFITKKEFIIIMELCDKNLDEYLKERKKGFTSEEIFKIMIQLNETFKIMVKENIVHRDIKLENILMKYLDNQKKNFLVKLTDYGISKQLTNSTKCKTHGIGTFSTMAPEIMEGNDNYNNKCDLWSIGIILYQLFFNKFPYPGQTQIAIYERIKKLKLKVLTDNKQLDNLILRLLKKDPRERLSWEEYFNHPFFNKSELEITTRNKNRYFSKIQEANEKDNNQIVESNIKRAKKSTPIKYLGCSFSLLSEGLVGLQNVGATCNMNATLQCFSNIERLRVYFLNHKSIIQNKKNKLSSSLLTIYEKLWEK